MSIGLYRRQSLLSSDLKRFCRFSHKLIRAAVLMVVAAALLEHRASRRAAPRMSRLPVRARIV